MIDLTLNAPDAVRQAPAHSIPNRIFILCASPYRKMIDRPVWRLKPRRMC